jgi:quercetin dioxygenase-like cupin family protein
VKTATVVTATEYRVEESAWGSLTMFVSGAQWNAEFLSVGRCVIKPGCANPRHYHPNCEEVIHLLQGHVLHEIGDGSAVELFAGDTISVPTGVPHSARNLDDTDAILHVSFSSAERKAVTL